MEALVVEGGDRFFAVIRTTIPHNNDLEISEILPQYGLQGQCQGPATVVGGNDYARSLPLFGHNSPRSLIPS